MTAEIQKVMTIGSGTMAQQIGTQCALFGCDVTIYARNEAEKESAVHGIANVVLAPIVSGGLISRQQADETLARIHYIVGDPAETPQDVDLVSESVLEDYDVKTAMWEQFAPHLPKHAILTTNTSSLEPSRFAQACGAPERFLSWHFYTPVFFQNVTDIMPLAQTDPKYVRAMMDFSKSIHENCCVLSKETPGFLANNMLFSVLDTALTLYRNGAADYEEIDRAWMGVRLANSGPFGIIDKIGMDTTHLIMRDWYGTDPANVPILADMVSRGLLGVKSGKGFYSYPNPRFQDPDFILRATKV